ncbi:MAG TPA: YkgJ family cysteine cluster protein [Candidatus Nanoarchaeia archaeon]|nr:YkgJ family cysteine cluster protein [Candidatus Nanoarchaeia archaeon]
MEIETLAKEARNSIGEFCMEECKSYCCRKGYLSLSKKEAALLSDNRIDEWVKKRLLHKLGKKYSFFLGSEQFPCPKLKDFKCTVHKDPNRPKACQNYPIFIKGNKIRLSSRCLAVNADKLYPYISQFLKLGYKIEHSYSLEDADIYEK